MLKATLLPKIRLAEAGTQCEATVMAEEGRPQELRSDAGPAGGVRGRQRCQRSSQEGPSDVQSSAKFRKLPPIHKLPSLPYI